MSRCAFAPSWYRHGGVESDSQRWNTRRPYWLCPRAFDVENRGWWWRLLTREFNFFRIANFTAENHFLAYGITIAIFIIATIIRFALDPYVLPPAPFFTYYPAVLLTAFFCGLWPALFAVGISGLTAYYFILPPRGSFEIGPHAAIAVLASLRAAVKKIAAQEQKTNLLAKELQHRTSNLLTVIQSIAHRSLAGDI